MMTMMMMFIKMKICFSLFFEKFLFAKISKQLLWLLSFMLPADGRTRATRFNPSPVFVFIFPTQVHDQVVLFENVFNVYKERKRERNRNSYFWNIKRPIAWSRAQQSMTRFCQRWALCFGCFFCSWLYSGRKRRITAGSPRPYLVKIWSNSGFLNMAFDRLFSLCALTSPRRLPNTIGL